MTTVPDTRLRLLQAAALTSTCDRFAIAPLLVVISLDLGASLAAVATVASVYFLAYGLMQPVWGLISDRIGRVRVMRIALVGAAVGGVGSVLAPDLLVLGIMRAVAGGSFAALIPTTLVYVGDAWPADVRQRPLSDVLAASSLGVAAATAGAGLLADLVGWRIVPGVTAVAAVVLWFALARLPEPDRVPTGGSPWHALRGVLRVPWAVAVLVLAFSEGIVVLGVLTFLAPAAQSLGTSATVAGFLAAGYGLGALAWSRLVRRLVGRVPPAGLAAIGGAFLVAAWIVPAVALNLVTIAVAGVLVGGSWAFLHSTLQAWVTEVVPEQRASAVALFAASLFLGSAAGTALFAPLAQAGAYPLVFGLAVAAAVPVAVLSAVGRRAYARSA
ncbi:MFS transporter [Pseudonocardia abyssalis]|uniref:MFS transporter n=2 Tax=Pseudonocardia abyssalis TaxID=2792008 RepID=UPI001CF6F85A|nr:MFS transporter [Pseudonocardia abyssalis]